MKKLLLSALIGAMSFTAFADDNSVVEFGYVTDTSVWAVDGIYYSANANLGIAIRIPSDVLLNYKGGKVIGMKVAAADQAKEQEIRAFVRKGTLTSENVASTTDYISWNSIGGGMGGFSSVLFDSPWTIPTDLDEDVYLGLFTTVKANQRVVGVSANVQSAKENTVFISESENLDELEPTNWSDILSVSSVYSSNVCIKCLIELPTENYQNVMMIDFAFVPTISSTDKDVYGYFTFRNDGKNAISNFELTTTFGEENVSQTITFDTPMPNGYTASRPLKVPVKVLGTGKHTYTITKVNGEANDASTASSSVAIDLIGVPSLEAAKHIRRPLYEYYCSESDHKSGVYQDELLVPSLTPYKGRVTFLPHHSDDKFGQNPIDVPAYINGEATTITLTDGDRHVIKLFNGINLVSIPAATLDRSIQGQYVELGGTVVAKTVMGSGTPTPQAFAYLISDAFATPTFASVELESEYNPETYMVSIKASGTIADLLPAGEKAKLSIFIVEENVVSDSQEFPEDEKIAEKYPDGTFNHLRVIRQTVTDFYGDELEPGQDFVKTYMVEIDNPNWNTDHMKVIAVIQRPETNDYLHMNIINTAEEPMSATYVESGIDTIEVENITTNKNIYDIQGRKLTTPVRGVNIINGKKILVK